MREKWNCVGFGCVIVLPNRYTLHIKVLVQVVYIWVVSFAMICKFEIGVLSTL